MSHVFFLPFGKKKFCMPGSKTTRAHEILFSLFSPFLPVFPNHLFTTTTHKPAHTSQPPPQCSNPIKPVGHGHIAKPDPTKSITNHPKPSTTLAYISSHNHYDTHQDNPPPHPCPNLYMTKISSLTDTSSC
jgi:hypothetical protein